MAHVISAMAAVFHRLLTLCLALGLVVGVPMRLVPCGMAETPVGVAADNDDGCAPAQRACTEPGPSCVDHVGCIAQPGVPAALRLPLVPFEWTALAYNGAISRLSGISIEPELSPPIRAA
jgi:hypothetical protein